MKGRDGKALRETALGLVADGKGVLAVDETPRTLTGRFAALGIDSTPETRRDFRELLFRTPDCARYIGGVILNDETVHQMAADGTPVLELLNRLGIRPGVKVDTGIHPLAGSPGEGITEGLDGLRERLLAYQGMGVRFTKWRALFSVTPDLPSQACIEANGHALARYAALSQEAGLVPIVEAEVLFEGAHGIERCYDVTRTVLNSVFGQLDRQHVLLEGMLLKSGMVLPGSQASDRARPDEVARRTVTCFKRCVPAAVAAIVFLSGGQDDDGATANLAAICRYAAGSGVPWAVSFSYARALQAAPMLAWGGRPENTAQAQRAFKTRAEAVYEARRGVYQAQEVMP